MLSALMALPFNGIGRDGKGECGKRPKVGKGNLRPPDCSLRIAYKGDPGKTLQKPA